MASGKPYLAQRVSFSVTFGPSQVDDLPTTEAWHEIETVFNELASLARSDLAAAEFHGRVLERLVGLLAAVGGVVWTLEAGRPTILCQLHLDQSLAGDAQELARHQRLAEAVATNKQPRLIPPAFRDGQVANASPWLAILCPVVIEGEAAAVIEIFQRPDGRTSVVEGYLRLVRTACELVEQHQRRRALVDLKERVGELRSLLEYTSLIHQRLDLPTTSLAIANEARRAIGCDRVSVLSCRGGQPKVEAISGVDTFDRRSGMVQSLTALARMVMSSAEPLWIPQDSEELPPQVAERLQAFLDESHARGVGLLPLRTSAGEVESVGLLCVEQFGSEFDDRLRRRSVSLAQVTSGALASALDYDAIPFRTPLQWIGSILGWRSRRRARPALLAAAALGVVVVLLFLIPAELAIESRGQLMPERRQHAFAPADGTVVELLRGDGATVQAGELLARLHSPLLDIQLSELIGKQRTVQEDLLATETELLRSETENSAAPTRRQLTARALQLKEELRGLEEQLAIVRSQQAQLEMKSPIAGTVVTWDAERQLAGRPVKRGDALLTVADLTGRWELLLDVPDHRAGHVLAARRSREELPITFQLGTEPGSVRRGTLKYVSPATELSAEHQPAVRMTASLIDAPPAHLRPGATVIARIHCGRRSVAYVWLHELWAAVRLRMYW